jgi:hypothetical protein
VHFVLPEYDKRDNVKGKMPYSYYSIMEKCLNPTYDFKKRLRTLKKGLRNGV